MGGENAWIFRVLQTSAHVVRGRPVDPVRNPVLNRRPMYLEDVVQHLGIALCSTCGRYPRPINSEFCGPSCKRQAEEPTWSELAGTGVTPINSSRRMRFGKDVNWPRQLEARWPGPPTIGTT